MSIFFGSYLITRLRERKFGSTARIPSARGIDASFVRVERGSFLGSGTETLMRPGT
jgi:hypothetical protein